MYRLQGVGPGRAKKLLNGLNGESTLADLQGKLEEAFGIPASQQHITTGFPPAPVTGSASSTLVELNIPNGSQLSVVAAANVQSGVRKASASESADIVFTLSKNSKGHMVKRDMPGDNSCLFHSVAYTCAGKRDISMEMRKIGADAVRNDPQTFTSQVLGKSPSAYTSWIMNKDVWGGAIELMVFAEHFRTEIVSFDYQYLREDIFGANKGYKKRAYVLYTGQHYDAMAYSPFGNAPESADKVVFSSSDAYAHKRARDYVEFLHNDACDKDSSLGRFKEWRSDREERLQKGHSMVVDGDAAKKPKWTCGKCTYVSNSGTNCEMCGEAPGSAPASSGIMDGVWNMFGSGSAAQPWVCKTCTFQNKAAASACEMCTSAK